MVTYPTEERMVKTQQKTNRRGRAGQYSRWYATYRWRKIRQRQLSEFPLCEFCQRRGLIVEAVICDHVEPHKGNVEKFWSGPFQSLCERCHNSTKKIIEGEWVRAQSFPDWFKPAMGKLTIVFGPPASGKSTYVNERCGDDLVIDLDQLVSEISGQPLYQGGAFLMAAIRERNELIGALGRSPIPAWLIATGTGRSEREWWERSLEPAHVEILRTPEQTCIQRIRADPRRKTVADAHIRVVKQWWAAERGEEAPTAFRRTIGVDGWPV